MEILWAVISQIAQTLGAGISDQRRTIGTPDECELSTKQHWIGKQILVEMAFTNEKRNWTERSITNRSNLFSSYRSMNFDKG